MGMLTEIRAPTQDALFRLTEQNVKGSLYITGASVRCQIPDTEQGWRNGFLEIKIQK